MVSYEPSVSHPCTLHQQVFQAVGVKIGIPPINLDPRAPTVPVHAQRMFALRSGTRDVLVLGPGEAFRTGNLDGPKLVVGDGER